MHSGDRASGILAPIPLIVGSAMSDRPMVRCVCCAVPPLVSVLAGFIRRVWSLFSRMFPIPFALLSA